MINWKDFFRVPVNLIVFLQKFIIIIIWTESHIITANHVTLDGEKIEAADERLPFKAF